MSFSLVQRHVGYWVVSGDQRKEGGLSTEGTCENGKNGDGRHKKQRQVIKNGLNKRALPEGGLVLSQKINLIFSTNRKRYKYKMTLQSHDECDSPPRTQCHFYPVRLSMLTRPSITCLIPDNSGLASTAAFVSRWS